MTAIETVSVLKQKFPETPLPLTIPEPVLHCHSCVMRHAWLRLFSRRAEGAA